MDFKFGTGPAFRCMWLLCGSVFLCGLLLLFLWPLYHRSPVVCLREPLLKRLVYCGRISALRPRGAVRTWDFGINNPRQDYDSIPVGTLTKIPLIIQPLKSGCHQLKDSLPVLFVPVRVVFVVFVCFIPRVNQARDLLNVFGLTVDVPVFGNEQEVFLGPM